MNRKNWGCLAISMLIFLWLCEALALLPVFSPLPLAAGEKKTYLVAVVPQFPPLEIKNNWTPLIEHISLEMGVNFELRLYKSFPDFEEDVLAGVPDFVYLSPYHATAAKKAQGYLPLIRDGENQLVGILVVAKDSAFKTVKDLNGKTLAFPSPNAFAASLYLRALLEEKEKIKFTPKYLKTHSNVYQHVMLGMAAAGGGANTTLNKESRELRDGLRIIYRTPGVAPHPISAHPRVPASVRKSAMNALLKLAEDKTSQHLLKNAGISRPVRADYARDYESLERLNLDRYVVKGGDQ
jgi:phosphonate transport system substrate-binding protein